jgi:hypothetical protein
MHVPMGRGGIELDACALGRHLCRLVATGTLAAAVLASCGNSVQVSSPAPSQAEAATTASAASPRPSGGTFPKITNATPEAVSNFVRQIDPDRVLSDDTLKCVDTNVNAFMDHIHEILAGLGVPDPTNDFPPSVQQSKVAANVVRVDLQQTCGVDVVVVQEQGAGRAVTKLARP